jgi:TPR repeat protein
VAGVHNLGIMYLYGMGIEKDEKRGLDHVRRAAAGGYSVAQYVLGSLHLSGQLVAKDYALAVQWLAQAAEQGETRAQFLMGVAHANGYGVPVDHRQAAEWYRKAAEGGHAEAQVQLAIYYLLGEGGLAKDRAEAVRWLSPAAEAGIAYAQHELALAYLDGDGDGAVKDERRAAVWMAKSAAQGYASALRDLGVLYRDGRGVGQDPTKAAELFAAAVAAKPDDFLAHIDLADLHFRGLGVATNPDRGLALLREAAAGGSTTAEWKLATLFSEGEFVAQNLGEAARWYRKLADRGDESAMASLAWIHYNGEGGVEQDFPRALTLFRQSADLGNPYSQYMAGTMYLLGTGIERDFEQAHLFLGRAADQGYDLAASTLGQMHENGVGVRQDLLKSEGYYRDAVRFAEAATDRDDAKIAGFLNSLGSLYYHRGQFEDAEAIFKRAIGLLERRPDSTRDSYAFAMLGLGSVYRDQGRLDDAEALYLRVFGGSEGTSEVRDLAVSGALAGLYEARGRYEDAVRVFADDVLPVWERNFADVPSYGYLLGNYARVLAKAGRMAESEDLFARALTLMRQSKDGFQSQTARILADFGKLLVDRGKYGEALEIFSTALPVAEDLGLLRHPLALLAAIDYARAYEGSGDTGAAIDIMRRAIAFYRQRAANIGTQLSAGGHAERRALRRVFQYQVALLSRGLNRGAASDADRFDESFLTAQYARSTDVASAVNLMAAKFSSADVALARLIRARQDTIERWRRIDKLLTLPDPTARARLLSPTDGDLAAQLHEIQATAAGIDQELADRFPDYATLLSPEPLTVSDVQRQLVAGEVLVATLSTADITHVWIVGKARTGYVGAAIGREELARTVQSLRTALDPANVTAGGALPAYPVNLSWDLYRRLLLPGAEVLETADHIYFIADGPLQSLPLSVLVVAPEGTGPIAQATPEQADLTTRGIESAFAAADNGPKAAARSRHYRGVEWLAERHAVTVLPSVSSLRVRSAAKPSLATKPFIGFGDPVLDQDERAPVYALLGLPPLPETVAELQQMADKLGPGKSRVVIGGDATEEAVGTAGLRDYRVVAFATHALVAGEMSATTEPALVLSPPSRKSGPGDGLLTASEIMALDLDSDLVILSACNTAAANGAPGAERLSGLAKSFFYAGARSLLVSHWDVVSDAAWRLTTGMFDAGAAANRRQWAQALQSSMLRMLHDETLSARYTHPMFWAPFTIVGAQSRAS